MAYTLKIRRYLPESGEAPYWQTFDVDLAGHLSVLEGILRVKAEQDGSVGIRCSCRAAICGSCGVRINGKPALACKTHLEDAVADSRSNVITVEPMGNMPVIKDLIVDMDAVHWKKIRRVTPWLVPDGPPPEREYIVPQESMIDVTQTMACIQCGACVSDCLAMEVDPEFVGPAALAKAYRFVGDPRDGARNTRLKDLSDDQHGIYDCTHCFMCIEACPKGVDPMNQIMRLRRIAGEDEEITDVNNGVRHEHAFVQIIKKWGTLFEGKLLPDSYGGKLGKFHPAAAMELLDSLPAIVRALLRRKVTPKEALHHSKLPKDAMKEIRAIYDHVEDEEKRYELNLYVVGFEEDEHHPERDDEAPQPVGPADVGEKAVN
jgi:succinate dehydrogenase / fumarate reductase iron-sulfur subunit